MCLVGRVAGIPSVGKPHNAFCPTIRQVLFREGRGLEIGRRHLILRARLRLNHCKKQRAPVKLGISYRALRKTGSP